MRKGEKRRVAFAAFLILGFSTASDAAEYYVDATRGNDAATGTRSAPWKTVARVNRARIPAGSTVYFKAGSSYASSVLVAGSGAAGSPVTYTSYGTGAKPAMGGFDATGKSYAKASGLRFSSSSVVVNLTRARHVSVDNCDIDSSATTWFPAVTIHSNSKYNRITKCTITQEAGNSDAINFRGNADYNLIQGNTITVKGIHAAIDLEGRSGGGTAHHNIIRNNLIIGSKGAGSLITLQADSSYNIVEGNTLTGDGTNSGYCGTNRFARHQTMFKLVSRNNIVRNNVIKDYPCPDSLGLTMEAHSYGGFTNIATGNHVYNNVITGIGVGGTALFLGENKSGGKTFNNILKNNVIYNNGGTFYQTNKDGQWPPRTRHLQMRVQVSPNVYDNTFQNNLFYEPGRSDVMGLKEGSYSVAEVQAMAPAWYSGNLQTNPLLDPVTQRPRPGSPVKGAGASLTKITSASGSGRTLKVDDAYYFSAGLGLVDGDVIQINGQRAAIESIDYSTGTLTLARTISWKQGDAVNLPFSGRAPDIGLLEPPPEDRPRQALQDLDTEATE